jgi:N-acetylglucosaminyl-diphospho-decaprenol L-rhamnosyltransferase
VSGDQRPQVDVGVVTWNTAELTVRALRHLLDTDQGVRLRLLVRDNASTDGTADAIERSVPEAEVDRGSDNLGFAGGVNTLIERASAPWFLALNSDAWPQPGAIARLVDTADRHARSAVVAPRLERPDGSLEHSTYPFPSLRVAAAMAVGGDRWFPRSIRDRLLLEGSWNHDRARSVDWAVGAALLMRRAALDEVGGFDEGFFMYAEDLDWCWRAAQLGWSIEFDPSAVVVHVGNASGSHRYGDRRTHTYLQNTHRWYKAVHGPRRSAAYRRLNALGALRCQLAARRRGDLATADWWRSVREVHRSPVDDVDRSRPGAG